MSQFEECLPPKLTANLLTKELGLPANAANNIEAALQMMVNLVEVFWIAAPSVVYLITVL